MSNKIDGYRPSTTVVTGGARSTSVSPGSTDAAPAAAPQASTGDTATVSSAARLLATLGAAVDQASGVDSAKVASLQASISAGTYQVNADSIAAKLLATQNEQKR